MKVHILATCRKAELLPATLMVFGTLRVGFPTADVTVHLNVEENCPTTSHEIIETVRKAGCRWVCYDRPVYGGIAHPLWLKHIITREEGRYAIVDTDIVFHGNCEEWEFGESHMAGYYCPRFYDHVTNAITLPRLHTSFIYVPDGEHLRKQIAVVQELDNEYISAELFKPLCYVHDGRRYFQDSMTGLYSVCASAHFLKPHLNCYDHLNNGTLIDIVEANHPNGKALRERAEKAFVDPQSIRGSWDMYEQYYLERKV